MMKNFSPLKNFSFVIFIFLMSCVQPQKTDQKMASFYVGTYTDQNSRGIYRYELSSTGEMINKGLVAETANPSYLRISNNGKYLIAVNEVADEHGMGSIESYSIQNDSLILMSRASSGGAHPCHIRINKENFILVSNYNGGNVALLELSEKGELIEQDIQQHEGKGLHPRQTAPHAHSAQFNPYNNEVIAADLGTNELWITPIDVINKKFIAKKTTKLIMEEGAGPRHFCFHPQKNWIYVLNELNGSITQVVLSPEGEYHKLETISTLVSNFAGENLSADIHISSDGRFVYASNRGPNQLAIFQVDEINGHLSLIAHEDTKGNWPRNFQLSPDDDFLLVAHQYSNNLSCFKRDHKTGLLTFISEIDAPSPTCILFETK